MPLIRLSPIGVLFLVASKMLEMESWEIMLGQLGMYFLTVMIGLFIHGFIVLQLIYFIVTRKLPFRYVGNLSEALATAFATSSRSDAQPLAFSLSGRPNRIEWLLPTTDVIRADHRIIGCVQNEIQPFNYIDIDHIGGRQEWPKRLGRCIHPILCFTHSSATLPVALTCLEEKNGVDPRVTRFVMPIGATINMDGTALYEAVAAIFISQVRGIQLTMGSVVAVR